MWRVLATLLVVCSLTLGGCTSINAGGEAIECARAGPSAVICDGIVYHRSINAGRRGLQHNETSAAEEVPCGDSEEALVFGSAEFWIYTLVCAVLVCSAGLFSGLTIGLMSLDVGAIPPLAAVSAQCTRLSASLPRLSASQLSASHSPQPPRPRPVHICIHMLSASRLVSRPALTVRPRQRT